MATHREREMLASTCLYSLYVWFCFCLWTKCLRAFVRLFFGVLECKKTCGLRFHNTSRSRRPCRFQSVFYPLHLAHVLHRLIAFSRCVAAASRGLGCRHGMQLERRPLGATVVTYNAKNGIAIRRNKQPTDRTPTSAVYRYREYRINHV